MSKLTEMEWSYEAVVSLPGHSGTFYSLFQGHTLAVRGKFDDGLTVLAVYGRGRLAKGDPRKDPDQYEYVRQRLVEAHDRGEYLIAAEEGANWG